MKLNLGKNKKDELKGDSEPLKKRTAIISVLVVGFMAGIGAVELMGWHNVLSGGVMVYYPVEIYLAGGLLGGVMALAGAELVAIYVRSSLAR